MTLYNLILTYFNKFHKEAYKNKLIQKPKNDHFNYKNFLLTNYVKKIAKNSEKIENKFRKK